MSTINLSSGGMGLALSPSTHHTTHYTTLPGTRMATDGNRMSHPSLVTEPAATAGLRVPHHPCWELLKPHQCANRLTQVIQTSNQALVHFLCDQNICWGSPCPHWGVTQVPELPARGRAAHVPRAPLL